MIRLYAQPYDITATGFYFETSKEYSAKAEALKNSSGAPVEEFEIQFIDGETIDADLAKAWQINQANFPAFLEAAEDWDRDQKIRFIIAVGECGHDHDEAASDPASLDLMYYEFGTMRELAEYFVDEGLFGAEVPENLRCYLDYDAIARDLSVDYSEVEIDGTNIIFHYF
ncbi:antirestriction protein ArdA [uncultured Roseibium sp.]|uniref:antirestriction protein ArdA n=1 Tax=uncultured Roseibium sp. TaxID=1936171 RepID=UPI00321669F0